MVDQSKLLHVYKQLPIKRLNGNILYYRSRFG